MILIYYQKQVCPTSQGVHLHSSNHQLKYLKLKKNLVCFVAGIQYLLIQKPSKFQTIQALTVILSKALELKYTMLWILSFKPWAVCLFVGAFWEGKQ